MNFKERRIYESKESLGSKKGLMRIMKIWDKFQRKKDFGSNESLGSKKG